MTKEEAIKIIKAYKNRLTNSVSNKLDKDIEAFDMAIKALEQEKPETVTEFADRCRECGARYGKLLKQLKQQLCEDEYIKVPKKALKYRTTGMVAYNVEWLKNHFDIERTVICGAQEPCEDVISRQAVIEIAKSSKSNWIDNSVLFKKVNNLPSVNLQEPTKEDIHREREQAYMQGWDDVSRKYRTEQSEDEE